MLNTVEGNASRLCPHVKTIKTVELIRMMVDAGIIQFKCATVAEGEAAIQAGANFVLLAIQPTLPHAKRWVQLVKNYPDRNFGVLVDCMDVVKILSDLNKGHSSKLQLWIDLNVGMNRTGVQPSPEAIHLAEAIQSDPNLNFGGVHAYDGHLHQPSVVERTEACNAWHRELHEFVVSLDTEGMSKVPVIAGGTPTFPMQAAKSHLICSPGTCVLWDAGYASHYEDLDFLWSCVILGRVISKPAPDLLCLDLGHKAVASEMPHPRIQCLNLKVDEYVSHSEEHLVIRSSEADLFPVGAEVYAVPWHVCPTVALHQFLHVVEKNKTQKQWEVVARNRKIMF